MAGLGGLPGPHFLLLCFLLILFHPCALYFSLFLFSSRHLACLLASIYEEVLYRPGAIDSNRGLLAGVLFCFSFFFFFSSPFFHFET